MNASKVAAAPQGTQSKKATVVLVGLAALIIFLPLAIVAGAVALARRAGVGWQWLAGAAAAAVLTVGLVVGLNGAFSAYWASYGALFGHHRDLAGGVADLLPLTVAGGGLLGLATAELWRRRDQQRGVNWAESGSAGLRAAFRSFGGRRAVPHSGVGLREGALHATPKELIVSEPCPGRIVVGSERRQKVVAVPLHLAIIAPTGAGKTRSLVIPNVLDWDGPAVATSVKQDIVYDPVGFGTGTWGARQCKGRCWIFEPTGRLKGYPHIAWSPLWRAKTWDGALRTAQMIADAAGLGDHNQSGSDSYFASQAPQVLAPRIFAAAITPGRHMGDVLDWITNADAKSTETTLKKILATHPRALGMLKQIGADKSYADVIATIQTVLAPWRYDSVVNRMKDATWTPRELFEGDNTLYILSLANDPKPLRPLYTLLMQDIVEVAQDMRASGELDRIPLFAMDETANISPIKTLPTVMSAGREWSRIMSVWQSLSQIKDLYGEEGRDTILGNAAQIYWPTTDANTIQHLAILLGERDRINVSTSRQQDSGATSTSESVAAQRVAAANEIRTMETPILTAAKLPACAVHTRNYDEDPRLASLSKIVPELEDVDEVQEEVPKYLDGDDESVDEDFEAPEQRISANIELILALLNNPTCRGEVAERFREHPLAEIRAAAAAAPNAPLSLLEELLNDPDPAVQEAARAALAERKHHVQTI